MDVSKCQCFHLNRLRGHTGFSPAVAVGYTHKPVFPLKDDTFLCGPEHASCQWRERSQVRDKGDRSHLQSGAARPQQKNSISMSPVKSKVWWESAVLLKLAGICEQPERCSDGK